ncbi:hypothetical protein [Pseudomonas iridis]|uniref:hypothetical protein n=1 Tax=Pseudomonas iridis TaxID=2710587 RepID=UPI0021BE0841|nr:hypothetical protein [Pseudomonas iridis]MCT8950833.1 hypothetical protein [Pseudomonas iridis]
MSKLCPVCKIEIPKKSKQWLNQTYCSTEHRKAANRNKKSKQTRNDKKRSNLIQNDTFIYVINQCRQAKTIQILTGHTLKSFTKTMELIKNKEKGDVRRCHIAPVKGPGFTGLLHYKNLFYGGTHQNELFGSNYLSGGKYIKNKNLKEEWSVDDGMSNNEILMKVEEFLGDIIGKYIEDNSVFKSKKIRIIEKIMEISQEVDKDILINKSTKYLNDELFKLKCSHSFWKSYGIESKYITYMNELTRFIKYRGKNKGTLKSLRKIMVVGYMALERISGSETYNKEFYCKYERLIELKYGQAVLKEPGDWPVFKDLIYDTVFKVLQGGDLDVKQFRKKIMSYLSFPAKALQERGLRYYRDQLQSYR